MLYYDSIKVEGALDSMCYREHSRKMLHSCKCFSTNTCLRELQIDNKLVTTPYCFQPVNNISSVEINISSSSQGYMRLPMIQVGLSMKDTESWVEILLFFKNGSGGVRDNSIFLTGAVPVNFTTPRSLDRSQVLQIECSTRKQNALLQLEATSLVLFEDYLLGLGRTQVRYSTFEQNAILFLTWWEKVVHGTLVRQDRSLKLVAAVQHYSTNFTLDSVQPSQLFSLQGAIATVSLQKIYTPQSLKCSTQCWVSWLSTLHSPHSYQSAQAAPCTNQIGFGEFRLKDSHLEFSYCQNISAKIPRKSEQIFYIFLREKKSDQFIYRLKEQRPVWIVEPNYSRKLILYFRLLSWNVASYACAKVQAGLPILRTREEMDNIVNLVNWSPFLPQLDALFIGAHQANFSQVGFSMFNLSHQVCFVCCCFSLVFLPLSESFCSLCGRMGIQWLSRIGPSTPHTTVSIKGCASLKGTQLPRRVCNR